MREKRKNSKRQNRVNEQEAGKRNSTIGKENARESKERGVREASKKRERVRA